MHVSYTKEIKQSEAKYDYQINEEMYTIFNGNNFNPLEEIFLNKRHLTKIRL